jgi:hypothetical protein
MQRTHCCVFCIFYSCLGCMLSSGRCCPTTAPPTPPSGTPHRLSHQQDAATTGQVCGISCMCHQLMMWSRHMTHVWAQQLTHVGQQSHIGRFVCATHMGCWFSQAQHCIRVVCIARTGSPHIASLAYASGPAAGSTRSASPHMCTGCGLQAGGCCNGWGFALLAHTRTLFQTVTIQQCPFR